jgi:hypothetical protein
MGELDESLNLGRRQFWIVFVDFFQREPSSASCTMASARMRIPRTTGRPRHLAKETRSTVSQSVQSISLSAIGLITPSFHRSCSSTIQHRARP